MQGSGGEVLLVSRWKQYKDHGAWVMIIKKKHMKILFYTVHNWYYMNVVKGRAPFVNKLPAMPVWFFLALAYPQYFHFFTLLNHLPHKVRWDASPKDGMCACKHKARILTTLKGVYCIAWIVRRSSCHLGSEDILTNEIQEELATNIKAA